MDGGDGRAVLDGWRRAAVTDREAQATLVFFTRLFAGHAGRVDVWERVLQGWDMKASTFLRRNFNEGKAEGLIEGMRETLLLLGRKRFGRVTRATRAALEAITDRRRLERMSGRLLDVATWQELLDTP